MILGIVIGFVMLYFISWLRQIKQGKEPTMKCVIGLSVWIVILIVVAMCYAFACVKGVKI
jgi:NhaP-type Na+/H+ or K+/H+ antiporter